MISAVIFDFDGVIVDSEQLHWSAFNRVLSSCGTTISWDDYIQTYIGFDDRDTFRTARPGIGNDELNRLIAQKAAAFQELLETEGTPALPGAVELIQELSGKIPLAICSGALREDIQPVLTRLGIDSAFNTIVTADDTHISKPDPAPYLLAVERLGINQAVAIEDTPAGIASAKGAGLNVLAVTNSYGKEDLQQADRIVDSLFDVTLSDLLDL